MNLNFDILTISYYTIPLDGKEPLFVASVYNDLLFLERVVNDKVPFQKKFFVDNPSYNWLADNGAFVYNDDLTISIGDNFESIKKELFEKKSKIYHQK